MSKSPPIPALPTSDQFRSWVEEALDLVGIKPAPMSTSLEFGVNYLKRFLNGDLPDIPLTRAAALLEAITSEARARNVDLPPLDAVGPLASGGE